MLSLNWICWGSNTYGEGDAPSFLKERGVTIVSASIGRHYLCLVVKNRGTGQFLHCWGANEHQQTAIPGIALEYVNEVSSGDYHTCVLYRDTHAVCFGLNTNGQLNIPNDNYDKIERIVSRNYSTCYLSDENVSCIGLLEYQDNIPDDIPSNLVNFQLGYSHYCSAKGSFECNGSNEYGQSTIPLTLVDYIVKTPLTRFHTYSNHNCASFFDYLICWGQNDYGQVENYDYADTYSYSEAVTGEKHTCAKRHFYLVNCWGSNHLGAIDINPIINQWVYNFSTAGDFTCVVKSAKLKCYGKNAKKLNKLPDEIKNRVEYIRSGYSHNCAFYNNSTRLACWGLKDNDLIAPPTDLESNSSFVYLLSSGFKFSCLAFTQFGLKTNAIMCWGLNTKGVLDLPPALTRSKLIQLVSGLEHSCAITFDENVHCWGSNDKGQLAVHPLFQKAVGSIALGYYHTCIVRDEMSNCVGNNGSGQADIPKNIRRQLAFIVAGGSHTCGVDKELRMECWGSNKYGQGDVIRNFQGGYTNVELGMNHTCVQNKNGKVKCFGDDAEGQVSFDVNNDE